MYWHSHDENQLQWSLFTPIKNILGSMQKLVVHSLTGAIELLEKLSQQGYILAVATGKGRQGLDT